MKAKPKLPESPMPLGEHGQAYWNRVTTEFQIEEHHLDLLASACQQLDRAASAAIAVLNDGVTVLDRFSQKKPNPAIDIERNAHLAFCRLQRELGLDVEPAESRGPSRPGARR